MGKNSRQTFQKREKEKQREQKQRDKAVRRLAAKERRSNVPPRTDGEDPDIAGIKPGPQPLPSELDTVPDQD
jgi:hypothetical protein